jgi:hypothetical protein
MATKGSTAKDPPPDEPTLDPLSDEQLALHRWRYKEARRMKFTWREAKLFASSTIDLEDMRALRRSGCSPELILRIRL